MLFLPLERKPVISRTRSEAHKSELRGIVLALGMWYNLLEQKATRLLCTAPLMRCGDTCTGKRGGNDHAQSILLQ